MFVNPLSAIQNGWVKNIHDEEKQIQPNAIDFTLDRVFILSPTDEFIISDKDGSKRMVGTNELQSVSMKGYTSQFFAIPPRTMVDGLSSMFIEVPEQHVCIPLAVRSTFNRNGVFITSGIYDSGYSGNIGFAIHNTREAYTYIGVGTRVGQISFAQSDSEGVYAGGWNHADGTHYRESENGK